MRVIVEYTADSQRCHLRLGNFPFNKCVDIFKFRVILSGRVKFFLDKFILVDNNPSFLLVVLIFHSFPHRLVELSIFILQCLVFS